MKKSYLKYFIALFLFGSNGIVASLIALSSYEIVLLRTMIGSALLIAIFFIADLSQKRSPILLPDCFRNCHGNKLDVSV